MSQERIDIAIDIDDERYLLEKEADLARARLSGAIEALAQRGRLASSPRLLIERQVKRYPMALLAVGGAVAVSLGTTWTLASFFERRRQDRLARDRLRAFGKLWRDPRAFLSVTQSQSVATQARRRLAIGVLTVLAIEPTIKLLRKLVSASLERTSRRVLDALGGKGEALLPVSPEVPALGPAPVRVAFTGEEAAFIQRLQRSPPSPR